MLVMLKSPSGPSPGLLRPSACRNARWHCGVKGSKECASIEEKRIYGESRDLGKARGLERQGKTNVHPHSVPFQFRWAFSFSDLGMHRKSSYRCKLHLTLSNQSGPCIRGIQLTGCAGCILAIETWLLSSLCFCLTFLLFLFTIPTLFHLNCVAPSFYYPSSSI